MELYSYIPSSLSHTQRESTSSSPDERSRAPSTSRSGCQFYNLSVLTDPLIGADQCSSNVGHNALTIPIQSSQCFK